MSYRDFDRLFAAADLSDRGGCSSSEPRPAMEAGRGSPSNHTLPHFVPNADLGGGRASGVNDEPPKTWGRAPGDAEPFDKSEPEGQCFACRFAGAAQTTRDDVGDVQLGASELRSAYAAMMGLIDTHYNNGTSVLELVNMVKDFYDSQILSTYREYGAWSTRSIYNHVFHSSEHSEDRQCNECIKALYHQIEFLRANTCIMNDLTGQTMPDRANVKLLMDLTKTHSTLVNERRRRASGIR